jgi:tetratricopeptide (TPR) repeat protein
LLPVFFGEEGILEQFQDLDDGVLILLVDWALRQSDVALAANLQSHIDSPPPGINIDAWTLRSARIQVLGGNPELGASQLVTWFSATEQLSRGSLDRAMQIVFDLQFLGEHEIAIQLFREMAHLIRTAEQKKELFYWMAQSWAGLGDYPRAAIYYLESASLTGESDLLWRQSAFYKAGQSLEDARYYSDAKKVYTMLLGNSSDPKMLAKLQYRLAQIQLAEIHRDKP